MTVAAKPPTQQDVAQRAGVSAATVSYVLSGRRDKAGSISAATRERVTVTARELGYQPNHAARSLRRRKTETVAVVYRRPSSAWSDRLVQQLQDAALPLGYSVITMPAPATGSMTTTSISLREQRVDGVILAPDHDLSQDELVSLARSGLALVVFDDFMAPGGFDVVRNHQIDACYDAVVHLIERGHRRIAFFGQWKAGGEVEQNSRYEAYRRALSDHSIPLDDSLVVAAADSRPHAFRMTIELLSREDPPTALFSASDRGALAAMWAAQQQGAQVPNDLAIVGVGNTDEATVITPALTSVGSAGFDFSAVVDLFFRRVTAREHVPGIEIEQIWRLFARDSS